MPPKLRMLMPRGTNILFLFFFLIAILYLLPWHHLSLSSPLTPSFSSPGTPVDVSSILTAIPPGHANYAWTENDASAMEERDFVTIGEEPHFIEFKDETILDVVTGNTLQRANEGTTFNLAVLKLPRGSRWGFVGVARGPTRRREFMTVKGHVSREQVLVAFGLNITSEGHLFAVTPGQTLDIPMAPKEGCISVGPWVATYGAEDPRLFWTDAGTPALTFARYSDDLDTCRSVGYVADLRDMYAPLGEALSPGEGVKEYDSRRVPGAGNNVEFIMRENQGSVEKNWVGFFPGALADGHSLFPHVQYAFVPSLTLQPTFITPRRIVYDPIDLPPQLDTKDCIGNAHSAWEAKRIHQASPLYRLTLCERAKGKGCVAGEENTVLFGLAHTKRGPSHYGKFIATFNVTYPHNVISVGPRFMMSGLNDDQINYVLTMAPIVPSDLNPSLPSPYSSQTQRYLPNHFFLDDKILFTLGHEDLRMVSVLADLKEVMGRQKICEIRGVELFDL
ncbi:hypothetical protein IAR55_001878 [Kwoniella newhampshirensis]|uniref:Uncharacterized protein n=1 Tax=Kwoniella newhampshirensis TaxID=1651941 RepID=A0AAW0Z3F7_9TREE